MDTTKTGPLLYNWEETVTLCRLDPADLDCNIEMGDQESPSNDLESNFGIGGPLLFDAFLPPMEDYQDESLLTLDGGMDHSKHEVQVDTEVKEASKSPSSSASKKSDVPRRPKHAKKQRPEPYYEQNPDDPKNVDKRRVIIKAGKSKAYRDARNEELKSLRYMINRLRSDDPGRAQMYLEDYKRQNGATPVV